MTVFGFSEASKILKLEKQIPGNGYWDFRPKHLKTRGFSFYAFICPSFHMSNHPNIPLLIKGNLLSRKNFK